MLVGIVVPVDGVGSVLVGIEVSVGRRANVHVVVNNIEPTTIIPIITPIAILRFFCIGTPNFPLLLVCKFGS